MPNPTDRTRWLVLAGVVTAIFAASFLARRGMDDRDGTQAPRGDTNSPCKRIVSLAPSITETLFALGMGDRVVGVTRFCDFPPEAAAKADVGGCYDPNYEAILRLQPDLVLTLTDHAKPREALRDRGLNVQTVDQTTVAGILESIRRIGRIGGVEEQAEQLVRERRDRLAAIARLTRGLPRPTVMLAVGRDVASGSVAGVYIAGRSGWYNELVELAGGQNAFEGAIPFPAVSAEGILKMNPDVIVEMIDEKTLRKTGRDRVLAGWRELDRLTAVRENRIHLFSDDFATIPGPRFIRILEKLARILHPAVQWDHEFAVAPTAQDTTAP